VVKVRKRSDLKILYLDIETAPTNVFTWSLFPKYININDVVKPGYTLCWAAMWEGEREVLFGSTNDGEVTMLENIHALLEEADAVVHYNGTRFDIPTLNREFVLNGMDPPSHYHQIDLLKTVRKQFKFQSNKLDFVCQQLGLGGKVKHKGMALWYGCMEGDLASWKQMETYNKRDVKILKKLYKRVLPWIHNHPNVGMWIDDPQTPVCTNCGSTNVVSKGRQYNTKTVSYQRYKCGTCGTPLRSRLATKRTSPNVLTRTS
jgi:DNA polymerase elongation subunit (family B)